MAQDKPSGPQRRRTDVGKPSTHHGEPPGRGSEPRSDPPAASRTSDSQRVHATSRRRHAQAHAYLAQVDALTARISAAWTDDTGAVDAIREQRREL